MDLRKGKEQVGVVGPDFIYYYESLQYYRSRYHEHGTEKCSNLVQYREFLGVYTRKKSRGLGCIP